MTCTTAIAGSELKLMQYQVEKGDTGKPDLFPKQESDRPCRFAFIKRGELAGCTEFD